jgi:hypothetical protein
MLVERDLAVWLLSEKAVELEMGVAFRMGKGVTFGMEMVAGLGRSGESMSEAAGKSRGLTGLLFTFGINIAI